MTNAPAPPKTPLPTQSPRRLPDSLWTFSTYFAEGFPYTVIRIVSALFFRDRGMSLEALGATSVFGLPWALKFLWGPQVDAYSSKRRWLILSEALLCLVILLAVPACRETNGVILVALLLFAGSWVAATHDIAIDGFYLEALDQAGQARYLGLRVMAYRIAMMTGAGAVATLGAREGWPLAFGASGLIMAALFLLHWRLLPRPEPESHPAPWPSLVRVLKTRPAWVVAGTALFLLALATGRRAVSGGLGQAAGLLPELIASLLFAGLMGVWLLRRRLHGWLLTHPQSFYGRAFLSFIDRPRIGVTVGFIT
ncbi:MAG: MFS transporter, partial [Desulfobacteraceae bacterium]|nr:MFS transporter [Desulfobacteraceae bacterium]